MSSTELVLASGAALMAPLLWVALGELVSELSGTLNVGVEGVMICAAFTTALAYQQTGSAVAAVLAAALSGVVAGVVLSALYVRLGTDHIVTGIVFTAIALGGTTVLAEKFLGDARTASLPVVEVPLLSDAPLLGAVLFRHNVLIYAAVLAVPAVAFLVRRTWFGLHLRAVGQRPLVVETAGLSVRRLRYGALVLGCVLTSLGGATLVLSTTGTFQPGTTGGRGYIALAVVVLARWNPFTTIVGSYLFGVAQAFQFQADRIPLVRAVPYDFVLMAPYLVAVAAVLIMRASRYPAAVGVPYRPADAASGT